jgi:hypothetical protein
MARKNVTMAVKTAGAAAGAGKSKKGRGKGGKGDYRHEKGGKFSRGGAG